MATIQDSKHTSGMHLFGFRWVCPLYSEPFLLCSIMLCFFFKQQIFFLEHHEQENLNLFTDKLSYYSGAEGGVLGAESPLQCWTLLGNILNIIMNFSLIWSLIIQILINNQHYHWIYAKGYVKRTQISIGGKQDQDTLIEQSPNHSNRAITLLLQ